MLLTATDEIIVALTEDSEVKSYKSGEQHEMQLSLLDSEHEDDSELPHCRNDSVLLDGRKR